MRSSSSLSPENQQKSYISKRTPDIVLSRRRRNIIDEESENSQYNPSDSSPSDIVLEPYGQSASGRWLRISEPVSHPLPDFHSDLDFNFMAVHGLKNVSTFKVNDTDPESQSPMILTGRSYTVRETTENLSKVPLPQSAALFYNGHSPIMEIIESCDGIYRLNNYLKSRKQDVRSGVPGRFLQAVIGPDICDVGSIVSTIMYAFYLNETQQSEQLCVVPVINTKRTDLDSHGEINWLLESCGIDHSSLVFADEIDLSYYDLFGSLKLVLVNSSTLPVKQEVLKEALVEIVSCKEDALSCCTLIAEKIALACPEILAGRGFSRLLLGGILLDTVNLTSSRTTSKDKYMSTLLLNGAGRFGCGGLYQIMRRKMYDVSGLLRKDFKKWTKKGKSGNDFGLKMPNVGMVSIGISIPQLLSLSSTSDAEITRFQQIEKLSLLVIVSGYYDSEKNFKREVFVSGESYEIIKGLVQFIRSNAPELPLKAMHQPELKFEMRVFEVDKVTSRRTIERLLEEYIDISK